MAIFGAFISAFFARLERLTAGQMRASLLIAVGIGLPLFLLTKHMMSKDIESYADFSLGIGGQRKGRTFRAHAKSIMAAIPMLASMALTGVCAQQLGLPYMPILGMLIVLSLVCYPEQDQVYRTMKARLENRDR